MMKNILHTSFILGLIAIIFSCSDEKILNNISNIEPGKPACLHIQLSMPELINARGIPDNDEKRIERIYIMVFYPDGLLVSKTKFEELDDDLSINAYTISGRQMDIYAIANYSMSSENNPNNEMENELDAVKSFSDYQKICYKYIPAQIINPQYLPMEAHQIATSIHEGNDNNIKLQFNYLHAKITLKLIDGSTHQNYHFTGWKLFNAATQTTIIKRDCDSIFPYYSMNQFYSFERQNIINGATNDVVEFYILENQKGNRINYSQLSKDKKKVYDAMDPSKKKLIDNTFNGKSLFAPDDATYIETKIHVFNRNLKGDPDIPVFDQIEKDNEYYRLNLKLYLGNNDIDDYNVQRGKHYIYTITFKDGYDVNVNVDYDSNIEKTPIDFYIGFSSSLTFDAHPGTRVMLLRYSDEAVDNLSVEITDKANKTYEADDFNATWLKVSPLILSRAQIKQSGAEGLWQEDVTPGYFCHPKYIPHKDRRKWLADPTYTKGAPAESYQSPMKSYTPPEGVTLGSDDFPDNDDCLPYSKATHRMCYKITDVCNNSNDPASQKEYLFCFSADEFENSSLNYRYANIRIRYYDKQKNENCVLDFPVTQISPLEIGTIPYRWIGSTNSVTSYVKLFIESIEENALVLYPDLPISAQKTYLMQWGYSGQKLSSTLKFSNGFAQTANAVFSSGIKENDTERSVHWGTDIEYRELYRSGLIDNNFNQITEPSSFPTTSSPYYYPDIVNNSGSSDYFDNTYNTTAARYCFEKNRDLDGDGRIADWETKWFLPSRDELLQI